MSITAVLAAAFCYFSEAQHLQTRGNAAPFRFGQLSLGQASSVLTAQPPGLLLLHSSLLIQCSRVHTCIMAILAAPSKHTVKVHCQGQPL